METNGTSRNGAVLNSTSVMELHLHISDSDLFSELSAYPEGEERNDFAISAMKIGAIALRQAQGRIDADTVRQEGERFIKEMGYFLDKHQSEVTSQISNCLKDYFDPNSGRFNDRVNRLVDGDGELVQVIRSQISGNGSELAQTLTAHVGKESPLMQTLDPQSSDGLISQISKSTEKISTSQKEHILNEFSLDNDTGALSRLVAELTEKHGEVGKALKERIDEVIAEFSLDKEDSALSRLVGQVEKAQRQISSEFSLDEESSALARMRRELKGVLDDQSKENREFQSEVRAKLVEMTARRQEASMSTRHGIDFEAAVFNFINERSQKEGDIATATGNSVGRIQRSKKGDVVIRIGHEHVAAGEQIVIEAKDDKSYTIEGALSELEDARKNRDAGIGLFVFSSVSAPKGLEIFRRYGNDIVVVWDAEDATSDVTLDAGLSVAKALCVQSKSHSDEVGADVEAIEKAVLEIEKQVKGLDQIKTSAQTIKKSSDKILERVRIMSEALSKQINILNEKVAVLR